LFWSPESEFHENYQRAYGFLASLFKEDFNPESAADMGEEDWGVVEFLLNDMKAAVSSKGCSKQRGFLNEAGSKITSQVISWPSVLLFGFYCFKKKIFFIEMFLLLLSNARCSC